MIFHWSLLLGGLSRYIWLHDASDLNTCMQDAEKTNGIYGKIGERLRQNPELVINAPTEAERLEIIRGLIATRKYAYIGVHNS